MSATLGDAVIEIKADTSKIKGDLDKKMRSAGSDSGSSFGGGMVGTLSKTAKWGGAALLGLAAAGATVGVKTAASMETADIAFTTMLGSAKKADAFLKDLAAFAAKTPFEFPELQKAASSLISSGIEAKKVIPIMTTLGNVTSGMGTGSEGIKRATVAIQQMNAAGKITGEDLNQLRDAGIPVYDLLAAATGKSKEAVSELAKSGKLGKKELGQMMAALESGKGMERFAGLMDKQSTSLSGLWSTLKDTINMNLAAAIQPLIPMLKDGLVGASNLMAAVLPKVTAGLTTFAGGLKAFGAAWKANDGDVTSSGFPGFMEKVANGLRQAQAFFGPIVTAMRPFAAQIGIAVGALGGITLLGGALGKLKGLTPVIGVLGKLKGMLGGFGMLASPLGIAFVAIGAIVGLLMASKDGGAGFTAMVDSIAAKITNFAATLPAMVSKITTALPGIIAGILPGISGVFTTLATVLPSLINSLVGVIITMVPVLVDAAVTLFSALIGALTQILPPLLDGVVQVVTALVGMLPTLIPTLISAGMTLFMGLIDSLDAILPPLITGVISMIMAIVKVLPTLIGTLVTAGVGLLMALVKALPQILPPLISGAISLIMALIDMLPTLIPVLIDAALTLFMALVDAIPEILPPLLDGLSTAINALVDMLPTLIPLLLDAAVMLFNAIVNSIPVILPMLITAAIGLIGAVLKLLPTLIPVLIKAAFTLFMAIVKAIPTILKALLSAIGTLLGSAFGAVSGAKDKLMEAAKKMMDGILKGIAGVKDKIVAKFTELVGSIGTAWDKVKEIAKKPIRWIIETVIGNTDKKGLIGAFNWLSDKIGGPHLAGIPLPAGFAQGGVLPGFTPGRDVHQFYSPTGGRLALSGGEAFMRPEFTRAVGGERGVKRLNDMARKGALSFARGGVYGATGGSGAGGYNFGLGGVIDFIKSKAASVFSWVGDKASSIWKAMKDPLSFIKDKISTFSGAETIIQYANAIPTKLVGAAVQKIKELFGSFNKAYDVTGVPPAGGGAGMGYKAQIAWLKKAIPSAIVTSSYRPGSITATGNKSLHGAGRAIDISPSMSTFDTILRTYGKSIAELIYSPANGRQIKNGRQHMYSGVTRKGHFNHVHWAMRNGGVFNMDSGGTVPRGLSMINNTTGRPETLLPAGQDSTTINVTVSVDDIARLSTVADFIDMLNGARVQSRKTARSGMVSA